MPSRFVFPFLEGVQIYERNRYDDFLSFLMFTLCNREHGALDIMYFHEQKKKMAHSELVQTH